MRKLTAVDLEQTYCTKDTKICEKNRRKLGDRKGE